MKVFQKKSAAIFYPENTTLVSGVNQNHKKYFYKKV
jgi:hypothetical protein